MAAEVDAIAEDFSRELEAIRGFLARAEITDDRRSGIDSTIRVAASNASLLLLAASFEEFIRELVRESCASLFRTAARFGDIPASVAAAAWERSLYILRGLGYGRPGFDRSAAASSLQTLDAFCLREETSIDVSELIGYNQNNMRAREINDMFKRVGISDICGLVGSRMVIVEFFGAANPNIAHARFVGHLDEFYESRNEIAHSIGSVRGTGSIQVSRHLDFFACASNAFAEEISSRVSVV